MKTIRILFIAGSVNDLEKDGSPTALVNRLMSAIDKLKAESNFKIDLRLAACSADRTPFLLPAVLNEEPFDGIIYSGGYSLVLGAALQEAVLRLRYEERISVYQTEYLDFLDHSKRDVQYLPGMWRPELLGSERSWLYGSKTWIPCIGVPLKEKASSGLSSFLSIVETPGLSEPRPVVGIGRSDTALYSLVEILGRDGSKSLGIVYDQQSDQAGALAHKLENLLDELGIDYLNHQDGSPCNDEGWIVHIGDPLQGALESLDARYSLVINLPSESYAHAPWQDLSQVNERLDHTLTVGAAACENCALLLARLKPSPQVTQKLWKLKHDKTEKSMRKEV